MSSPRVLRYAAFTTRPEGGNPAGVVLGAEGLDETQMQRIAAEVDYAETAFVTGTTSDGEPVIRYFSPVAEVPFCGHATLATAVALAEQGLASAIVTFRTPVGPVVLVVDHDDEGAHASFTSVEPSVAPLPAADLDAILVLLGLPADALDPGLPPRLAHAGNPHPVLVLADRAAFDGFTFAPTAVRALMDERRWPATITVAHRTGPQRFVARNLFPVGRITEDPATGSAAAAFGAYLRALGAVLASRRIVIDQGEHVGRPGVLIVDIPATGGIVVSGHAVPIS